MDRLFNAAQDYATAFFYLDLSLNYGNRVNQEIGEISGLLDENCTVRNGGFMILKGAFKLIKPPWRSAGHEPYHLTNEEKTLK